MKTCTPWYALCHMIAVCRLVLYISFQRQCVGDWRPHCSPVSQKSCRRRNSKVESVLAFDDETIPCLGVQTRLSALQFIGDAVQHTYSTGESHWLQVSRISRSHHTWKNRRRTTDQLVKRIRSINKPAMLPAKLLEWSAKYPLSQA